jgi:hypothetical protein
MGRRIQFNSSRGAISDRHQIFLADERAAIALVTKVLQNVGPSVTRFSPTYYAELLEYLHHGKEAADVGYARPGCTTRVSYNPPTLVSRCCPPLHNRLR